MLILFIIIGTIALFLILVKLNLNHQFNKAVKMLLGQPIPDRSRIFNLRQLDGLPEPAQRYFKHVLKIGQTYINQVSLTHGGQFKMEPDKAWLDIEGEQYFTTPKPGFVWKGSTWLFTAFDSYINESGRLMAWVLSIFKVADSKGGSFDEGELQRWLAESVWFPTNLLPSQWLSWSAIDPQTAKLSFNYKNVSFFFTVLFNEIGEIVQMETQRFMSEGKREAWLCQFSEYHNRNGVVIPILGKVTWLLEKGDFCYARFRVKTIKYDWIKS
ncbi:MAG: hypothetical protein IPN76_33920 [Saprospiraceae bacterium]|nr:hypothetical protein [Saprospiraceae bacterium]